MGAPQPPATPSFVIGVPATTDTSKLSYSYVMRLGAQDDSVEHNAASNSGHLTSNSDGWNTQGGLFYAVDKLALVSPEIDIVGQSVNTLAPENLTVTVAPAGGGVINADYSFGHGGAVTYSSLAQVNVSNSMTTILNNGLFTTVTAGQNAVTGGPLYLCSNIGLTENIFYGAIVNISNSDVEILTPAGSAKLSSSYDVFTAGGITLGANCSALQDVAWVSSLNTAILVVNTITTVIGAATGLATGVALDIEGQDYTANASAVKDVLMAQFAAASVCAGLVVAIEAMAAAAGLLLLGQAEGSQGTQSLILNEAGALLKTSYVSFSASDSGQTGAALAAMADAIAAAKAAQAAATAAQEAATAASQQASAVLLDSAASGADLLAAYQAQSAANSASTAATNAATNALAAASAASSAVTSLAAISAGNINLNADVTITISLGLGGTSITLSDEGIAMTGPTIKLNGTTVSVAAPSVAVAAL